MVRSPWRLLRRDTPDVHPDAACHGSGVDRIDGGDGTESKGKGATDRVVKDTNGPGGRDRRRFVPGGAERNVGDRATTGDLFKPKMTDEPDYGGIKVFGESLHFQ